MPERDVSAQTKHGDFVFSSKCLHIGRTLFLAKECDYEDIQQAARILKTEGHADGSRMMIDVGANIGTVCVPLVRQGFFSGALAVEPEPRNFSYLTKNIQRNDLSEKIQSFQLALSNQSGTLPLYICAENFGDHRIAAPDENKTLFDFEPKRKKVDVRVETLDRFLSENGISLDSIGLLWMDIQGHEPELLMGAQSVLEKRIPIVTEVWPFSLKRDLKRAQDFFALMKKHYTFFYDLKTPSPTRQPIANIDSLLSRKGQDEYWATNIVII